MHLDTIATVIGGIFAIIVLVAAALAVARANFAKAQIEALRGDRDDQEKRIKRQDEEIAALQRDVEAERRAREALEKVVTGRDLMEALRTDLTKHHEAAMDGLQKVFLTMEEAVNALAEIKQKVGP